MLDLKLSGGTLVTESESFRADIGIEGGKIACIGLALPDSRQVIDAEGLFILPGGVDAHCHIDEPPYGGAELADDFTSASRAAACGGTTTIIPFVNQLAGRSLRQAVADYREKARASLVDYAFHIILKKPGLAAALAELEALLAEGYRSIKLFMTYPGYMMDDSDMLAVMHAVACGNGTVLVHAENGHCIQFLSDQLASAGQTALSAHAEAAPPAVEREAAHRAISLAEVAGCRLLIVHVSAGEALEQIEWAKRKGLRVLAETCPQYLACAMTASDGKSWEDAKLLCSPPPRPAADRLRLWQGIAARSFDLLSSDHCPYRFDGARGKKVSGASEPDFRTVPPGLPGIETRLPVFYEHAVAGGRLSINRFVALTSANPARIYGLYPRKGSLMPGSDADLAVWDMKTPRKISHAALHDACDYTPYEGMYVSAWPVMTISRGSVIWAKGEVSDEFGRGRFLRQQAHESCPIGR
ncbi:MAG: dihydropyrimidinase [Parvibaculaceae bacterium]